MSDEFKTTCSKSSSSQPCFLANFSGERASRVGKEVTDGEIVFVAVPAGAFLFP
jgi:hypothetical protein